MIPFHRITTTVGLIIILTSLTVNAVTLTIKTATPRVYSSSYHNRILNIRCGNQDEVTIENVDDNSEITPPTPSSSSSIKEDTVTTEPSKDPTISHDAVQEEPYPTQLSSSSEKTPKFPTKVKMQRPFLRDTQKWIQSKSEKFKEFQNFIPNIEELKAKHQDFHKRMLSQDGVEFLKSKLSKPLPHYLSSPTKFMYSSLQNSMNLGKRTSEKLQTIMIPFFWTLFSYFSRFEEQPMTNLAVVSLVLLGSSLGFVSFLYFISIGYGIGVALPALVMLLTFNSFSPNPIPIFTNIHTGLVALWGIRLALFLLDREYINWKEWHIKVKEVDSRAKMTSKFSVWMSCTVFYTSLVMPCLYRMRQTILTPPITVATTVATALETSAIQSHPSHILLWGTVGKCGIGLQIFGLLLESISDHQKATFKAKPTIITTNDNNNNADNGKEITIITTPNRNKWCHVGLWKYFTHPNFLGDALFWLGTWVAACGAMNSLGQYVISAMGVLCLFFVLMGATEQLDRKQWMKYKKDRQYVEYCSNVGFLGPKLSKIFLRGRKEKAINYDYNVMRESPIRAKME